MRRFLQIARARTGLDRTGRRCQAPTTTCTNEIDLVQLEPLIAMPSSPGNVVPVREVAGQPIYQAYIGSSANPGYRDFAIAAEIVRGKQIDPSVSFDVNPTSRQILENLDPRRHTCKC